MDRHEKYNQVCEQFGSLQNPNPPMRIDWMPTVAWSLLFDRENLDDTCLVYLQVENRIGIADRHRIGYTPTPCCIYDGVDGQKAVDWFNEHILELSAKEAHKILFMCFFGN